MTMTDPSRRESAPPSWEAIERYYRTTNIPVSQIAEDFEITGTALRNRIKEYGWTRNDRSQAAASRHPSQALAAKLAQIVASELSAIARQKTGPRAGAPPKPAEIEKLARTIRHISELEAKEGDAQPTSANQPRVVDDARRLELARRLEGIRRQFEYERDAARSEA
jgi:hypothetical protein